MKKNMGWIKSQLLFAIVFVPFVSRSDAFVPTATAPIETCKANMRTRGPLMAASISRREVIHGLGSAILTSGVMVTQIPTAGAFDETDSEPEQFAALRTEQESKKKEQVVKENAPLIADATDGLKNLDSFVNEKDYISLRSALRRPPINQLRSSSRTVILNLIDETRKAEVDAAYKALIKTVEELDRVASTGVKKGLPDDNKLKTIYEKCVEQSTSLVSALPQ